VGGVGGSSSLVPEPREETTLFTISILSKANDISVYTFSMISKNIINSFIDKHYNIQFFLN